MTGGLIALLRLARPLFLVGGFVFYGLGVAIARYEGVALHLPALLWGQLAVTAAQLMTHFANDYFDLAADRANSTPTRWSGGSRVLAEGLLPPQVGLWAALVCGGAALAAIGAVWAVRMSAAAAVLLLLATALAWFYSAPPARLHSRGLGEWTVAAIVPVLTPLVGYTVQRGVPGPLPLLAAVPPACFQVAMIMVINFPDAAGDRQVGKRTLVLRLGGERAARLHPALLALGYLSLPLLVWAGLPPLVAVAVLLPLPLAIWLAWQMSHDAWRDPTAWNALGFWSIGLLMATAGLELLAFLVAGRGMPWLPFG
ncbi:MAG TPA: prenyltransferase [Promineifilum sp.]|nr:prenyltransferase [Promineifilum sp.]HQF71033.1 prenyltransferase [Promineifilum sp.]